VLALVWSSLSVGSGEGFCDWGILTAGLLAFVWWVETDQA
jgi:hypothetical protein